MRFRNREHAAALLAERLGSLRGRRPLVVGVFGGGVLMARILACELDGDLDVALVARIAADDAAEPTVAAVSESGAVVVAPGAPTATGTAPRIARSAHRRLETLRRQRRLLQDVSPAAGAAGRVAVVVDDGAATGTTMRAALDLVRHRGAVRVIAALGVASPAAVEALRGAADDVVFLEAPAAFRAVADHFSDFLPVTDDRVLTVLLDFRRWRRDRAPDDADEEVSIPCGPSELRAGLEAPPGAKGLVVIAGAGAGGRASRCGGLAARGLGRRGLATLLVDLLTESEARRGDARYDGALLRRRLEDVVRWTAGRPDLATLPTGLLAAGTVAACALETAAELPERVQAVVAVGGRLELAAAALERVAAPTLLVDAGGDPRSAVASRRLRCPTQVEAVAGAAQAFDDPAAARRVADLAADWFTRHLAASPPAAIPMFG